jgi:glucosyl-3-phosphoglycerate synthase
MSDFWQHGPITTIHRLPGSTLTDLESLVKRHSEDRPATLLIPALASEMDGPAWPIIMAELQDASFLNEVILALGAAAPDDLDRAKTALDRLPMRSAVVWPESDNLSAVLDGIRPSLDVGPPGKGRDVWIAMGYILGRGNVHAVALTDADIITYTRELPMRLLAPLLHPNLSYDFCKGYYARVSGTSMAGRVTRLLVVPLVSILVKENFTPSLRTIGAMRYALAGEFAMTADLAARIPIPRDWGLEVGILSAVARAVPFEGICQADLCDNYEHKHQELHPQDTTRGLNRMAVEITAALLREVEQVPGDLISAYQEQALSMIPKYRADALANGLNYNEEREKEAVQAFARAVEKATGLKENEIPEPLPAWGEVEGIVPGLMSAFVAAVERDNS